MRRLMTTLLSVALAISVAGTTACSRKSNDSDSGPAAISAEETASVDATQSGGIEEGEGGAGDTDTDSPQTPATKKELTDIQTELSAIEKELGSLDMPSDSDFSDIESSLR